MVGAQRSTVVGFVLAILSAASFALSGIFASALMDAGWTAGSAVTTRVTLAALVLLTPTLVMLRGRWELVRRAWRQVLLFGVVAVAGCQLAFFLSVQFIPPSLALLIEFMGPVLLMLWFWVRTGRAPSGLTILGAVLAVLGLVAISGVILGVTLHPLGVMFALIAAVGVAVYFLSAAESDHGIPPIPFVGLGLIVGAVTLAVAGALRVLPFSFANEPVVLAGYETPAWLAVSGLAVLATALPYGFGVQATRILGATMASFTGYSETMFAILWTILLLGIVPTGAQWLGAALILSGVVLVKLGDVRDARRHRLADARADTTADRGS